MWKYSMIHILSNKINGKEVKTLKVWKTLFPLLTGSGLFDPPSRPSWRSSGAVLVFVIFSLWEDLGIYLASESTTRACGKSAINFFYSFEFCLLVTCKGWQCYVLEEHAILVGFIHRKEKGERRDWGSFYTKDLHSVPCLLPQLSLCRGKRSLSVPTHKQHGKGKSCSGT